MPLTAAVRLGDPAERSHQRGGPVSDRREAPPEVPGLSPELLAKLARTRMPFGRYAGQLLVDLPEPYVVWFRKQGFPRGRLGEMLALLYEIKANGLEPLVRQVAEHVAALEDPE